ncbi:MAG: MerR family transcriptional regulator [Thermaurantiacus tibetensis]|uniref:MerR family transcriptional regulator n=1 Tax=Thermaurantiacus tibetensis TaxID=2759035 RepID=UPI00188FB243|nr:MerR family transcriptional regulator [Thermaurantiacus tibetensis]
MTEAAPLPGKAPAALRTISEVSAELGVPQHILRFWETRFPELRPMKRGGNRRYYRPADVALCRALHRLLHAEGYTVKGVQRLLASQGARGLVARLAGEAEPAPPAAPPPALPAALPALPEPLAGRLAAIRDRLARALA